MPRQSNVSIASFAAKLVNCRYQAISRFDRKVIERNRDFSPVESPGPMKGIYFVGVLLNRKP